MVKNNFKNSLSIILNLLLKDIIILNKSIKRLILTSLVTTSLFIILYKYFLPALGMVNQLSLPLFLGTAILGMISMGYTKSVMIQSDLNFNRSIDYYLTLPITINWLIFYYILSFSLDLIIASLIPLITGLIILDFSSLANIYHWIKFLIIYPIILGFTSLGFLLIVFSSSWHWFLNNTWERILSPCQLLGSVYFLWFQAKNFSTFWATIALLIPTTYMTESLRSIFTPNVESINWTICFIVLLTSSSIIFAIVNKKIKKRLDPV